VPTPWPSWLIAGHPDRAFPDATNVFLAKLTDYVVEFNSEESRATKNVAFIEEKFGYPKKDIEVRIKNSFITQVAHLDTGVVDDRELSPRLCGNLKKRHRKHTRVLPESHFMSYFLIYLSASSRKLALSDCQRTASTLTILSKKGL